MGTNHNNGRKTKKSGSHSCLVIVAVLAVGAFVLLGLTSAVIIPAFLKYLNNAKASEAPATLAELESRATQYYQDSSADGTCQFPPSADPVPADQECCEGIGPSDGDKWTPPAGTWEQEGWRALQFSISQPTYFAYQMINTSNSKDESDRLELRAFADFNPGGPRHTYSITLEGHKDDQGECVASAQSPVLSNEFE